MGFYAPAQLIRDARAHGVTVRPADINASRWDCTLEPDPDNPKRLLAVRLGFRVIKGVAEEAAANIVLHRYKPYASPQEVWRRSGVQGAQLDRLAQSDVFAGLGYERREAVWAVKALSDKPLPLFLAADEAEGFNRPELREQKVTLAPLTEGGEVAEDYINLSFSLRAHPLHFLRDRLTRERWISLAELDRKKDGDLVRIAGLVLVRQRPGTASGIVFVTIEDETAHANLVVWSTVFETHRAEIMASDLLACTGKVQREGRVIHVVVQDVFDLSPWLKEIDGPEMQPPLPPLQEMRFISRDFH
jgi:error-prone DNA polymerase